MLSNVTYGKLLAQSLGVTRGELQKMAEAGQLTVDKMLKPFILNSESLRKKSADLGQTFEQTITVNLNKMKLAIGEINKEFDLSGKFARGIDWFVQKLGLIGVVIGGVVVVQLLAMVSQLKNLLTVLRGMTLLNWVTGLLMLLGVALIYVYDNLEDLTQSFARFQGKIAEIQLPLYEFFQRIDQWQSRVFGSEADAELNQYVAGLREMANLGEVKKKPFWETEAMAKGMEQLLGPLKKFQDEIAKGTEGADKILDPMKKFQEELDKMAKAAATGKTATLKDIIEQKIAGINKAFNEGRISAQEYFAMLGTIRLERINGEMAEGKSNVYKLNEALAELQTQDLTRQFNRSEVSLSTFREELNKIEIQRLNDQLTAGTLAATEFNDKMLSLQSDLGLGWNSMTVGITNFLDKVGTLGKGVADVVTNSFDKLGDAIYEMTKTGKYDFRQFAQSVLDDLGKIIMRATIVAPLARGILSYLPTAEAGVVPPDFNPSYGSIAKMTPFAKGGIVSSPTPFMFNRGKMGVMGESGPEAVLPLTRGAGGELGVRASSAPVIININNQSGAEVTQHERTGPNGEKMIDIMVVSKMKEAFASGTMDKTMQQAFGIRRMGY